MIIVTALNVKDKVTALNVPDIFAILSESEMMKIDTRRVAVVSLSELVTSVFSDIALVVQTLS